MTLTDSARLKLLTPPAGRLRVVLDTDTYNEIDDQFALVQMLLSPERFDVEAIYAAPFFNARADSPGHGMELSYQEILRLLERLNVAPDGLVHRGVTDYVGPTKSAQPAPAVDDLVARARAGSPDNPLYVIAIGAISNVASALLKAPDIIDRIVVVWLGGHALEWPDTIEFNLKQDVGGAQVLLDSGVPLVLVPCRGVTSRLHSDGAGDRALRRTARQHRRVPRDAVQGVFVRSHGLGQGDLGHGAGRLAAQSYVGAERDHPGPGSHRTDDLERRPKAASDPLRDLCRSQPDPEGLFREVAGFRRIEIAPPTPSSARTPRMPAGRRRS